MDLSNAHDPALAGVGSGSCHNNPECLTPGGLVKAEAGRERT